MTAQVKNEIPRRMKRGTIWTRKKRRKQIRWIKIQTKEGNDCFIIYNIFREIRKIIDDDDLSRRAKKGSLFYLNDEPFFFSFGSRNQETNEIGRKKERIH